MAYLGLARKWRPQTFDDLVGQGHIARTVSNAIKAGRVSQGYLFTGTRGIGKTSAARIFAKALRCNQTTQPGVPCNKCNDCIEISEGRSTDVLEIDGASNNGVDAVREIRENAKYLPSTGKFKIYIIDEVHMLTTAAFNALLKTLEEPPAHVIFIFATTDPQKIPATVLSRCQRFDFKRVPQKDLQARLKYICTEEKMNVTDDALAILAREAEGSMRDAVSLLDQILSVGEGSLDTQTITHALGLIDKQTVLDCVSGILKRDPLRAIDAVGKVYLHGFDLKQFGREILRYLRQIMVARLLEQSNAGNTIANYMDISDIDLSDVKTLIHERSLDDLDMLFRLLNHGLEDVARSAIPKMVMDVLVIKMAASEDLVSVADLNSPPGGVTLGAASQQQIAPMKQMSAPTRGSTASPVEEVQASAAAPAQASPTSNPNLSAALAALDAAKAKPATRAARLDAHTPSPASQNEKSVERASSPQHIGANLEWWQGVVSFAKTQKPLVGSILEHMGFESAGEKDGLLTIRLGYTKDHSFYKDQLQSRAYQELVQQMLKNYLGRAARLEYKEVLSSDRSAKSLNELDQEKKKVLADARKKTVLESEAMRATQQLLGAKLEKLEIFSTNGEVQT